jgi:hypothetical protein
MKYATGKTTFRHLLKSPVRPAPIFDWCHIHRFFNQMPKLWQEYLKSVRGSERKTALMLLSEIITDGNDYLCDDVLEMAHEYGSLDADNIPIYKELTFNLDVSRVINSAKVNDHFALTSTAEIDKADLDRLPDGERKILLLVCNKLLCATADKHESGSA